MYDATHKALRLDRTEVRPGDKVTDHRGETWIFEGISRVPGDGTATEGKVYVKQPGGYGAEFYRSVFDLTIVPRELTDTTLIKVGMRVRYARRHLMPVVKLVTHANIILIKQLINAQGISFEVVGV